MDPWDPPGDDHVPPYYDAPWPAARVERRPLHETPEEGNPHRPGRYRRQEDIHADWPPDDEWSKWERAAGRPMHEPIRGGFDYPGPASSHRDWRTSPDRQVFRQGGAYPPQPRAAVLESLARPAVPVHRGKGRQEVDPWQGRAPMRAEDGWASTREMHAERHHRMLAALEDQLHGIIRRAGGV